MTLELWTIEIEPGQLAACLQAAAACLPSGGLQALEVEWWNRPAEILEPGKGMEELKNSPADSPRGSAFGPQAEIRWRKVNDKLRLVITSETALSGLVPASPNQAYPWKSVPASTTGWDGSSRRERSLLLWGSDYAGGTWSELRIGRPLAYPVQPQKGKVSGVMLKIIEYLDATGQVVLARRAGLLAQCPDPVQEVQHV